MMSIRNLKSERLGSLASPRNDVGLTAPLHGPVK